MNSTLTHQPTKHRLCVNLTNLTESDLLFLTDVVALFTDPGRKKCLEHFRAGHYTLAYDQSSGTVVVPQPRFLRN